VRNIEFNKSPIRIIDQKEARSDSMLLAYPKFRVFRAG